MTSRIHYRLAGAVALAMFAFPLAAQQPTGDPHLWLEGVEDPKALEWVERRNRLTLGELERHPAFDSLYRKIHGVITTRARIAYPSVVGERFYNFWTDAEHPRGLWRRTTPASYATAEPRWETVIDVDSLAAAEKVPWAWKGASCLEPEYRRCLVRLSRGGADAVQIREFDAVTKRFVEGGFWMKEAKQNATWRDENTLLVSSDFGPGTMTTSGYARIVKLWRRGTPIDSARTLFEGEPTDVSASGGMVRIGATREPVIWRSPKFFESMSWLVRGDSLLRIDLPLTADWSTVGSQIVVRPRDDWTVGGRTIASGSLVAMDFEAFLKGRRDFHTLVAPTARRSVQGFTRTKSFLLVETLDNVRAELQRFAWRDGRWTATKVPIPDMASVGVTGTSDFSDRYFITLANFVQPTSLYQVDGEAAPRLVKQLPAMFDARGLVIRQHEATSKDGTRIPYFIVHRDRVAMDGANPTLVYGYGGFEVSYLPSYSGTIGSAWLERGGVYVLANIRGGGEFGPEWHKSAMKEHKQRSYDDFVAVAEDLVRRRVTSPKHLGIMGGSNGGLLVGAAVTQRPDLYGAAVIQVPLLDMQRYHRLLAGASWMAEYGDPDKPEEWEYIARYSPYQNLRAGTQYPRVLITTTTRDDRVHPGHARKFAAKLEAQGHPFYYFENTEGGHGSGVTPEQQARMQAVVYTYLTSQLMTRPPTPVP